MNDIRTECGQRPSLVISGRPAGTTKVTTALRQALQAMADAFACDQPEGHDGDHEAHDIDGGLLCWWDQP